MGHSLYWPNSSNSFIKKYLFNPLFPLKSAIGSARYKIALFPTFSMYSCFQLFSIKRQSKPLANSRVVQKITLKHQEKNPKFLS